MYSHHEHADDKVAKLLLHVKAARCCHACSARTRSGPRCVSLARLAHTNLAGVTGCSSLAGRRLRRGVLVAAKA